MSVLGRINGPMLKDNLERLGVDLAVETDLLYIDVNNNRIGINTSLPAEELDVYGNVVFKNNLKFNGTTITSVNPNGNITFTPNGTGKLLVSYLTANGIVFSGLNGQLSQDSNLTFESNSLVTLAANVGNFRLATNVISSTNSNGNVNITPNGSGIVNASNLAVTNLTSGRIVYVTTNGRLTDSANLTFDGTNLNVSGNIVLSSARLGNVTFSNVTVSTSLTNANLNLTANGSGYVNATNLVVTGTSSNQVLVTNSFGVVTTNSNLTYSSNTLNVSNISLANNTINVSNTNGNLILEANGTGIIKANVVTSFQLPVGPNTDRPAIPSAGMIRWNSQNNLIEYYNGSIWDSIEATTYSSIVSDTFNGDGSTLSFTLTQSTSTSGVLVSINGVIQKPTTAYTVSGTTLTFTEAPLASDIIEARIVAAGTTVTDLFDSNTGISASDANEKIDVKINGTSRFVVGNTAVETTNSIVSNVTGQSVGNSLTVVDTWAMTTYSAAKYIVVVANGTSKQVSEVLLTHNSTTASHTQYTVINTGSNLGTISSGVNGSNVELRYTGAASGNTVKLAKHYIV